MSGKKNKVALPGETIQDIERSLNYEFKNTALLQEALCHPSLKQHNAKVDDYERLEILGDSIVGFLVTEMIFKSFIDSEEGNLAKIKAWAVSKDNLSNIGSELNLQDHIIMTEGEENSGGRTNISNIENALEALIAAVYLDSDMSATRKIVQDLWGGSLNNIDISKTDPKSTLQEKLQASGLSAPKYELIKQEGPSHEPIFTIQVRVGEITEQATAKSKKQAEKEVALKILNKLDEQERFL